MITYNDFRKYYDIVASNGSEIEICFSDGKSYIIQKFRDGVNFSRCGLDEDDDEKEYPDFETLYHSILIDDICLERDWNKIESIIIDGAFDLCSSDDQSELNRRYGIK